MEQVQLGFQFFHDRFDNEIGDTLAGFTYETETAEDRLPFSGAELIFFLQGSQAFFYAVPGFLQHVLIQIIEQHAETSRGKRLGYPAAHCASAANADCLDHDWVIYTAETNCFRNRTSFCEYRRRSLMRYLSWQIL